jgi:hypothetical protein
MGISKKQKKSKEVMASEQKQLPNWFFLGSANSRSRKEWHLKKPMVYRRKRIDRQNMASLLDLQESEVDGWGRDTEIVYNKKQDKAHDL